MGSEADRHDAGSGTAPPAAGGQGRLKKVVEAVRRELAKAKERQTYERLLPPLRKFIRKKVSDADAIDTIAQESLLTFIVLERAGKVMRDVVVFGIAARLIAAYYRRNKQDGLEQKRASLDSLPEDSDELAHALAAEIIADFPRIRARLDELSPEDRAAFYGFSIGMTGKEVGARSGESEQKAFDRLYRANKQLAKSPEPASGKEEK